MFSKNQIFRFYVLLIFQIVVFGNLPIISHAQQLTYDVQYLSTEEGLSDHRILAVLEHSNGFTWVGTYNGLNRFDGYEFVLIDLPARKESTNGTLDTYIHRLFELETGDIAVIYGDGGIQINNIAIIYDPKTGKSEEVILSNFDESTGTLNLEKRAPLKFLSIKKEWTVSKSIVYDHHKNFFKIENQDGKQSAVLTLKTGETLDLSEVWNSLINSRVFGNDFSNIIYFSSLNGLVKLDIHRSPFKTYLNEQLKDWGYNLSGRAISDIGNGRILFSTEQKDLALLDKTTGQINYISIPKNEIEFKEGTANIRAIFPENDSIIWLTTYYSSGLIRLNINSNLATSFLREDNIDHNKFISSIFTTHGKILTVTEGKEQLSKLISFDPETKEKQYHEFASSVLSKAKLRSTCLLESKNGNIWVGTTIGLFLFDLKNKKVVNSYFKTSFSNKDTTSFFPKNYLLSANSILSLYENNQGKLLIGLEGGGLNILNIKTGAFEVFNTSDGLANNTVCSILPNENGYWLGTYNGLSFFDDQNKTFRNFYKKNGLPHNEFNRFSTAQDSEGINYFGGMNGFISFDPREVLEQNDSIKILLNKAIYFDKDGRSQLNQTIGLENNLKISIPSNNRNCSFLMAMTDFKNAENHQFEYQLNPKNSFFENDEAIWQSNGRDRKIQFEYLPAGDYDLNIRGTSSEGI
ncbi:MAG: two-component regulator propeller domain-containing protein, partial [Saprospiraceae bacterium]